jgi:cytochrome c peroxidase
VPEPAGNLSTPDKVLLGKALFYDEQLSSTGQTSCATCHINSAGGSDPRSTQPGSVNPGADGLFGTADDVIGSLGVIRSLADGSYDADPVFGIDPQVGGRKAPTMINAAFAASLFWDGRAEATFKDPLTGSVVLSANAALESQAAGPVVSEAEMAHVGRSWADAVTKLQASNPLAAAGALSVEMTSFIANKDYTALFDQVFGPGGVTASRAAMAIAAYERSLISNKAPIVKGANPFNLTQQEMQGMMVFNMVGSCSSCHGGPLLTNNEFRNTGVSAIADDLGLGGFTGNAADDGLFKVPNLLNIELRGPYFHNGSAQTLMDVVEFYDRGGDHHVGQDPLIQPLGLSAGQKSALVAFLGRPLTDTRVTTEVGPFARPTLFSESNHVATHYGTGTAASSGVTPRAIAVEPQYLGNHSMTVAVADAPSSGAAFMVFDFAAGSFSYQGAMVLLGATPSMQIVPVGPMQGSGPSGGYASTSIAIPSQPALTGLSIFMQWFVQGTILSATEGVEMVLY